MRTLQPQSPVSVLLRLSRWRFWSYLAGPYLLGYTAGIRDFSPLLRWWFWVHLLFFLFPANLLLYGVNDLFDADTDSRNPKKGSVEHRLSRSDRPVVRAGVAAALGLALVLVAAQRSPANAATLLTFLVLAIAYSAPPVRLKARPILDSASNVLYAVPGFLGWQQASEELVPMIAVLVAGLWTAAMHLFSAIPDIRSDSEAGLRTTATVLGFRASLVLCAVLWLTFVGCILKIGALWPWSLALLVYPAMPVIMLSRSPETAARAYWYFPAINSLMGMAAVFAVGLSK